MVISRGCTGGIMHAVSLITYIPSASRAMLILFACEFAYGDGVTVSLKCCCSNVVMVAQWQ